MTLMDMSGLDETQHVLDRELIARVLRELARLDRATRTKSGLARRAGKSRVTLNEVYAADPGVRDDTFMAFADAVLVPPVTLLAVGRHDRNALARLDLTADQRQVIEHELAHPDGSTRNSEVM